MKDAFDIIRKYGAPAARRSRPAPITEEEETSLLSKLGGGALSGLGMVGNLLDLPGSMIRDLVTGENPLDQILDPLGFESEDNRTTGRGLLREYGLAESDDTAANWTGGLAAEIVLDPTTYMTFGASALGKAGKAAKMAGLYDDAARVASKAGMGAREFKLSRTLNDIIGAAANSSEAKNAAGRAAKGMGVSLEEILDRRLGGSIGGLGPNFTKQGSVTLPGAMGRAKALDKLGHKIRYSPVMRPLMSLFDHTNQFGVGTEAGQKAANAIYHAEEAANTASREAAANMGRRLHESGWLDPEKIASRTEAQFSFGSQRDRVATQAIEAFGPQAETVMPLMEAHSRMWAESTGNSADDWFERITDIRQGRVDPDGNIEDILEQSDLLNTVEPPRGSAHVVSGDGVTDKFAGARVRSQRDISEISSRAFKNQGEESAREANRVAASLMWYQGGGHENIGALMRGSEDFTEIPLDLAGPVVEAFNDIQGVIRMTAPVAEDHIVHRGSNYFPSAAGVGDEIPLVTPMSTSFDPKTASVDYSGDYLYEIEVPRGNKFYTLGSDAVRDSSDEAILPAGTNLRYMGESTDSLFPGKKIKRFSVASQEIDRIEVDDLQPGGRVGAYNIENSMGGSVARLSPREGPFFQDKVGVSFRGKDGGREILKDGKSVGYTNFTKSPMDAIAIKRMFPGAGVKSGDDVYRIHGIELNESMRGQGLGKKLLLDMLNEKPGSWFYNSQLDEPAVHALKSLMGDGLVETHWRTPGRNFATRITEKGMNSLKASASLRQGARGAVEFAQDGSAVITAFKNADISTLAHEVGHVFRRSLSEIDDGMLSQAEKALGVTDGAWTREAEEGFASGFERYLRDGVSPTKELEGVFSRFKTWLEDIYRSIVGTPLEKEVSPELRGVFDSMLGGSPSARPEMAGLAGRTSPANAVRLELDGMASRVEALRGLGGRSQALLDLGRARKGITNEAPAPEALTGALSNEAFDKFSESGARMDSLGWVTDFFRKLNPTEVDDLADSLARTSGRDAAEVKGFIGSAADLSEEDAEAMSGVFDMLGSLKPEESMRMNDLMRKEARKSDELLSTQKTSDPEYSSIAKLLDGATPYGKGAKKLLKAYEAIRSGDVDSGGLIAHISKSKGLDEAAAESLETAINDIKSMTPEDMKEVAEQIKLYSQLGKGDMEAAAEELRRRAAAGETFFQGNAPTKQYRSAGDDAITRRSRETYEYLEGLSDGSALPRAVKEVLDESIAAKDAAFNRAQQAGVESNVLDDAIEIDDDVFEGLVQHWPAERQGFSTRSSSGGAKLFRTSSKNQKTRKELFKGNEGGRAVFNDLSLDPEISGLAHQYRGDIPDEVMNEAIRMARDKYGDRLGNHTMDDAARMDRYRDAVTWASNLDPRHAAEGIPAFKVNPVETMQRYVEATDRTTAAANGLYDFLAGQATLSREAREDAVSLFDILGKKDGDGVITGKNGLIFEPAAKNVRGRVSGLRDGAEWAAMDELGDEAALKSLFVPSSIADDASRFLKTFTAPEEAGRVAKFLDGFLNLFKGAVTSPFPAFHVRNFTSGQYNNLVGGSWSARSLIGAWNMIRGKSVKGAGEIYGVSDDVATRRLAEEVYANNLIGGQHGQSLETLGDSVTESMSREIPGMDTRIFTPAPAGATKLQQLNPLNVRGAMTDENVNVIARIGGDVGSATEKLNRISPYVDLRLKGFSPREAAAKVKAQQGDYSRLNPFERKFVRRAIPFYNFTRQQIPFTFRNLSEKPGGVMAQTIKGAKTAQQDSPIAPDYVRESASIPIDGTPLESILGKSKDGGTRYLTGLGLAWEDMVGFVGGPKKFLQEVGSRMNPLLKAPVEWATGRSLFRSGASLDSGDPTVGRTIANIKEMLGGEKTKSAKPFGSQGLEFTAANTPISRLLSSVRQITDTRKGVVAKGFNLGTGLRVADVSPDRTDSTIANLAHEQMKELGARSYENVYLPKDVIEDMSDGDRESARLYNALIKMLNNRRKERAK